MRWSGSFVLIHKAGIRAEKGRSVFVIEELRKKAGAGETAVVVPTQARIRPGLS